MDTDNKDKKNVETIYDFSIYDLLLCSLLFSFETVIERDKHEDKDYLGFFFSLRYYKTTE